MSTFTEQISQSSGVLRPRFLLQCGNITLPTAQRIEIHHSRLGEAGFFTISVPVLNGDTAWFDPDAGSSSELSLDIYGGFLAAGQEEGSDNIARIFSGLIDYIEYRPQGQIVIARGRDWAARLIEYELSGMEFLNVTAAEALQLLAEKVGLEANTDPTEGLIGQFYQYEHKAFGLPGMHRFQTAWDFCVGMQREYGYDLWVDGKTLYFRKPDTSVTTISTLDWSQSMSEGMTSSAPVQALSLSRRFIYSRGAAVTVSAWDARQKGLHSATWPAEMADGISRYNFTAPVGTTQDQCLKFAQLRFNDLLAHERVLHVNVHPELDIAPRQRVRLQGTGTSFDSIVYTVDDVTFRCSAEEISKTVTLRVRSGTEEDF